MAIENTTKIFPKNFARDMLIVCNVPASSSVKVQFELGANSNTFVDVPSLSWTTTGNYMGRFNPCGLRYRVLITGTATYELTNQS